MWDGLSVRGENYYTQANNNEYLTFGPLDTPMFHQVAKY